MLMLQLLKFFIKQYRRYSKRSLSGTPKTSFSALPIEHSDGESNEYYIQNCRPGCSSLKHVVEKNPDAVVVVQTILNDG